MNKNNFNRYDEGMDIEAILVQQGMVDELLYYKDLQQRRIFLDDIINQATVSDVVRNIIRYNREDIGKDCSDRVPILLYLCTPGGDEESGFQLIDTILNSQTPVYTINLGYQYSMGFIIGISGAKRFATRNARFLVHDGSVYISNSSSKVQDRMEFDKRINEREKELILSRTKITDKEYEDNYRKEWYMFADEAKERGVVDCIIGEDCTLDEIL